MNNRIEFSDFMKLAALVFFGLWFVINMGAQVYGIREGSIPSLPTNIIIQLNNKRMDRQRIEQDTIRHMDGIRRLNLQILVLEQEKLRRMEAIKLNYDKIDACLLTN